MLSKITTVLFSSQSAFFRQGRIWRTPTTQCLSSFLWQVYIPCVEEYLSYPATLTMCSKTQLWFSYWIVIFTYCSLSKVVLRSCLRSPHFEISSPLYGFCSFELSSLSYELIGTHIPHLYTHLRKASAGSVWYTKQAQKMSRQTVWLINSWP